MRDRVWLNQNGLGSATLIIAYSNGNPSTFIPRSFESDYRYSAMRDVDTVNFKSRSMSGELIFSPMEKVNATVSQDPARFTWGQTLDSDGVERQYTYPCTTLTCQDSVSKLGELGDVFDPYQGNREEAIASAWADVDVSEIQALASLGEMPETVRWIASLYRRAIILLTATKRKQLSRLARRLTKGMSKRAIAEQAADVWMEYRYAFRPLVFEMQQACLALAAGVEKHDRGTGRGYKSTAYTTNNTFSEEYNANTTLLYQRTTTHSTEYRAGVLFKIQKDLNSALAVWGLDQPLESLWEIYPLSFVADWFFNIGPTIASWTSNPGLLPLGAWVTETALVSQQDALLDITKCLPSSGYTLTTPPAIQSHGHRTISAEYKRRIIDPSRSVLPSLSINLDYGKTLDLAIIGKKLFRSGFRVKIGGSNVR